ncbi:MAG: hypothetical protein EP330_28820 [Deltaproteobacteria bacterium]|nr:MAG: hypothetical protein EP330_28820 [Deltaproteobacteria bacterium]
MHRSFLLLAMVACGTAGDDTDTGTLTPVGVTPANLDTVCAADSLLPHFALPDPVDFLALRRVSDMGAPAQEELATEGTACASATDVSACESTLADTWPTSSGWGYCGEGCSDSGLVWTRGDEVGLADSADEVRALFGTIDAPAEVLMLLAAEGYLSTDCASMRELENGGYQLEAVWLVSDCEWTEETRLVEVSASGAVTIVEVLDLTTDGACA